MTKLYISNKDETVRMFKNDFLEAISKVHPAVPVVIFLPVILYFIYISISISELTAFSFISLFIAGLLIWSFTEYSIHRFVFHYSPKSKIGHRIHFIFHGVHHDYPKDSRRLVMPPSVSIPLTFIFYNIFRYFLGNSFNPPFFAGFLTGYLFYDMMHFAIHHFNSHNRLFLLIKKHHMKHHYMDNAKGFGVSNKLWDYIYKTDFEPDNGDLQDSGKIVKWD